MKRGELIRYAYCADWTLGELTFGRVTLATIERPWRDNKNDVSCIPEGVYDVVCFERPDGDRVYALVNPELGVYLHAKDIPAGERGRFLILIHVGNWVGDIIGCVAPGRKAGITRSRHSGQYENAVIASDSAMDDLRRELGWPDDGVKVAELLIRQVAGAHLFG